MEKFKEHFKHPAYKLLGAILIYFTVMSISNKIDDFMKKYEYYQKMTKQVEKATAKIPKKYRGFVIDLCEKYNVPLLLLYRLVYHESRWNRYAVSRYNNNGTRDYGIAQLNSACIRGFIRAFYRGKETFNVYNPKHSLEIAVKLLNTHYRTFKNWYFAVCAYNAGANSVRYRRIPTSTRIYAKRIMNFI